MFHALGTRGDFVPLLGLAQEMRKRGHECYVLANECFEAETVAQGMQFVSIAPEQVDNLTSVAENVTKYWVRSFPPTFEFFKRLRRESRPIAVINTESMAASSVMCELYRLPMCRVYLAPFKIRSIVAPSWPISKRCEGPLGRVFMERILPKLFTATDTDPFILNHMNHFRQAWGLPPACSVLEADRWVRSRIAAFPAWFCPPAADWPERLEMTGFIMPESHSKMPPELTGFIGRWGKPLVFTAGTGVTKIEAFFRAARDCCERLAMPGVFISRHLRAEDGEFGPKMAVVPYVPLELLLQNATALVHHGGIGTTARAMQAGIPQVISPQAYDQPDNAHRVAGLSLGTVVGRKDLSGASLARAVLEVLQSRETVRQVAIVKRLIDEHDAIRSTADLLERDLAAEWPEAVSPLGGTATQGSKSSVCSRED